MCIAFKILRKHISNWLISLEDLQTRLKIVQRFSEIQLRIFCDHWDHAEVTP